MNAVETKRQPQLTEQLDITEKKCAVAHELSRQLADRLSAVLRPEQPTEALKACKPPEQLIPAADRVRNCGNTAEATINTLNSILERLEA